MYRVAYVVSPVFDRLRLKAGLLPGDEEVGREAARYMRFASAAYGMLMLKVKVDPADAVAGVVVVVDYCGGGGGGMIILTDVHSNIVVI